MTLPKRYKRNEKENPHKITHSSFQNTYSHQMHNAHRCRNYLILTIQKLLSQCHHTGCCQPRHWMTYSEALLRVPVLVPTIISISDISLDKDNGTLKR